MEETEKGKGNQRRNVAIANLTELSSNLNSMEKLLVKSAVYIDPNTYNRASVISEQSRTIKTVLPTTTNIPDAYANGSSEEQAFIQNLALFFTSFDKFHICVLESTQENTVALLMGLEYLLSISYVDDTEVFKVCLDYWNSLVLELFEANHSLDNPAATANMMGLQSNETMHKMCKASPGSEAMVSQGCHWSQEHHKVSRQDKGTVNEALLQTASG